MKKTAIGAAGLLVAVLFSACGDTTSASSGVAGQSQENHGSDCQVTFGLAEFPEINALDYQVEYDPAEGEFAGEECTNLLADSASDVAGARGQLRFGRISTSAFTGPVELDRCHYVGSQQPQRGIFIVTVSNASTAADVLTDLPTVEVTNIDCNGAEAATSTTTTTLSCDAVDCSDDERCIAGACVPGNRYRVEFSLVGDGTVGGLQVAIPYTCEQGQFVGSANEVACNAATRLNVIAAFNDEDEKGQCDVGMLVAGIIAPTGIEAPAELFSCAFESSGGAPLASDFNVFVRDMIDRQLKAVSSVGVEVTEVR